MQLEKLWSANGTKTQQLTVELTVFVAAPMGGCWWYRGEGAVAELVEWASGRGDPLAAAEKSHDGKCDGLFFYQILPGITAELLQIRNLSVISRIPSLQKGLILLPGFRSVMSH